MDTDCATVEEDLLEAGPEPCLGGGGLVLLAESADPVDEKEQARLVFLAGNLSVEGQVGGAYFRISACPVVDNGADQGEQTRDAFLVVPGNDVTDVRHGLDHVEAAAREVESVHLNRSGTRSDRCRDGQRSERLRLAGTRCSVVGDIAFLIGQEILGDLILLGGCVKNTEDQLGITSLLEFSNVVGGRELRQPRLTWLRDTGHRGGTLEGCDDALNIRGDVVAWAGEFRRVPLRSQTKPELFHLDGDGLDVLNCFRPRVTALKHGNTSGTGLCGGAAGRRLGEVSSHGIPENVLRIVRVRHAQSNAQVRVRSKVLLDDSRGALCREDEVQAKGTPALGDVDDAVDELRDLID